MRACKQLSTMSYIQYVGRWNTLLQKATQFSKMLAISWNTLAIISTGIYISPNKCQVCFTDSLVFFVLVSHWLGSLDSVCRHFLGMQATLNNITQRNTTGFWRTQVEVSQSWKWLVFSTPSSV
jgi:hypothetical protein